MRLPHGHAPSYRLPKGKRWEPQFIQDDLQPEVIRGRLKPHSLRPPHGRFYDIPWYQAVNPPPIWPIPITKPRIKPVLLRRGKRFDPLWPQQIIPGGPWYIVISETRPRIKPALLRRGKRFDPIWPEDNPASWSPTRHQFRMSIALPKKGRRFDPEWPQSITPTTPWYWVSQPTRPRIKPALQRRGKRIEPQFVQDIRPSIIRGRLKVPYQRRGKIIIVWSQAQIIVPQPPCIKFPTSATLAAYTSSSIIRAYASSVVVSPYTSTGTIGVYSSSVGVRTYISAGVITSYTSTALVRYTSTATLTTGSC